MNFKKINLSFRKMDKKNRIILLVGSIVVILLLIGMVFLIRNNSLDAKKKRLINAANREYEMAMTGKKNGANMTFQDREDVYRKSIDALGKVLQVDSTNTDTLMKLASSYYNTGEVDKAIATLEKATKYDPTNNVIFNNLGNFYQEKKDYENTVKNYEKSISLDPKYAKSYVNLAVVQSDFLNKKEDAIATVTEGLKQSPDDIGLKTLAEEYKQ